MKKLSPAQEWALTEITRKRGAFVFGPAYTQGYTSIPIGGRRIQDSTLDALVQAGKLRRRTVKQWERLPDGTNYRGVLHADVFEVVSPDYQYRPEDVPPPVKTPRPRIRERMTDALQAALKALFPDRTVTQLVIYPTAGCWRQVKYDVMAWQGSVHLDGVSCSIGSWDSLTALERKGFVIENLCGKDRTEVDLEVFRNR